MSDTDTNEAACTST